jgi:hypothetical protein
VAERDPDLLHWVGAFAEGDFEPQVLRCLVDEEQRGGPRRDDARGRLDDPLQEV